jgi:uncharacterized phage-associated protein
MSASAFDVAAALRQELNLSGLVQLNKLLYYTQGWHLAWFEEPLFNEEIQAFRMGPVVAAVSLAERDGNDEIEGDAGCLDGRGWAVVRFVAAKYGRATGATLTRKSHQEPPWINARDRAGVDDESHSAEPIGVDEMREYFKTREGQDQAWFWSSKWQEMQAQSLHELAGSDRQTLSIDEFLALL